jgi:MFS family permease
MVLKKVGPATWLSFLTLAWGLVTLGIGFSRSWQTLAVCRVFLGVFEAVRNSLSQIVVNADCVVKGTFPGCLYLMASYYDKFDLQKR